MKWTCKKCGTVYSGDFCPNCGTPLAASGQAQQSSQRSAPTKPKKSGKKIVGILILIIGIFMVFSAAINWEDDVNLSSSPTTNSQQDNDLESNEIAQKGKVTYQNFEKIETGMTYEQVVEIFGKEGKILSESDVGLSDEYKTVLYYWYDDLGIANCNVTIQGGKVIAKAQVGLR